MCGIAGIFSFESKVRQSVLNSMINVLSHRGPDGECSWINPTNKVGLAHRRLSILDLSSSASQPMHYLNNRYTITYNGEIYNYSEIKKNLELKGYTFKTKSDTEVILANYDYKKENCLSDFDGMFSFAIWDEHEQQLFCARDRFGEKPFYYYFDKSKFVFASEIKALFKNGIQPQINNKKIFNYLLYSIVENEHEKGSTFYSNIFQLEPSNYFIVKHSGDLIKKRYWNLHYDRTDIITNADATSKFTELFTKSVTRRLRSDVPVGSSLSGGIDSSSIVLLIDNIKANKHIQKTFSARFNNFIKDEGKFIDYALKKAKDVQEYYVFPTIDSVTKNLEKIFYHQEEPIGSTSIAIQFEVMKLARQNGVSVLLDGQGADELLAGYNTFYATYLQSLYFTDHKKFKKEYNDYAKIHHNNPIKCDASFITKAAFPRIFEFSGNIARSIKSPTSPYFKGINPEIVRHYQKDPNPIHKPSSLKQHLHSYLTGRNLSELLRYADRNAMANSVEVRLPFLSHDLVEFVFTLPDHLLLNEGWTKYVLRKSMEPILPREITWRKDKIGFEPPQDEWLKSKEFKEYTSEAISFLLKEKIITKPDSSLNWEYISLHRFLKLYSNE